MVPSQKNGLSYAAIELQIDACDHNVRGGRWTGNRARSTHLGEDVVMATLSGFHFLALETEDDDFSSSLRLPENEGSVCAATRI